jgi:uncharacterized protein (DUF2461 family)
MALRTNQPAETARMNFTGFPAKGLQFLRELAENNDPAWFKPRREEYEAHVRGPMVALVADLLQRAALTFRWARKRAPCRPSGSE